MNVNHHVNCDLVQRKKFLCKPSLTLLDSVKKCGVVLEYSCRSGRCGVCKAKVVGETEVVHHDESALSPDELASGVILTCCRTALGDVRLNIDDLSQFVDIRIKTLPCRVDSFERLTDDVVEVVLRMPQKDPLNYLPGRYLDIIGKSGLRRSYSIANAPRQDGKLEFRSTKLRGA